MVSEWSRTARKRYSKSRFKHTAITGNPQTHSHKMRPFHARWSIKPTDVYINIEHTLFDAGANDEFTVKVAEKPDEIKALLEVGFEYV